MMRMQLLGEERGGCESVSGVAFVVTGKER
jgi:hypothetical protein